MDATSVDPAELVVRLRQEAHRPFDLARGPLLRLALFDVADGEQALLLAVHHIVADFWSLAVVARDLAVLYAHEVGRLVPALPPLPLTYAEFARWQRERMSGPEGERLWAYWRARLGEDPPRLDLAAGRPRPKVKTYRGDSRNLRLGTDLAAALAVRGRDRGTTLATTLFAGFAALLYRYTGEEDLLVGSPIAGRGAGTADLVGYFVNPVVLRTDLSGDPSFGDLLGRARVAMLAAFEHQDYPFNLLAGRLERHRDPARAPLFDVAFAFEKARGAGHDLGAFALGLGGARLDFSGVELESLPLAPASAPFDLSLVLAEIADGLGVSLRFNTDLFDGTAIERLGGHLQNLLAGAAADPHRRLADLPLLAPAEERELLVDSNRTAAPYDRAFSVEMQVAARAERTPEAPAVAMGGEGLTYAELDERAGRLAGRLRALGVGPETRVAVAMERSPVLIVALLAVWKAGGAYVPLDPAYPPERLAWQLGDAWEGSPARVLLAGTAVAERLAGAAAGRRLIVLDSIDDLDGIAGLGDANAPAPTPPPVLPESAAYVIYTSGSTGRPKGVVVPHAALANLVRWHVEAYGLSAADRAAQVAGIGFDAAVWEIWPVLAAGASLHLAEEVTRAQPADLVAWLAREAITIAFLPTPLAEAALAEPWPAETALRTLLTGGDRLHRAPRPGLPFTLVNHYGPTESTVVATAVPVPPAGPELGPAPPPAIGRPIANTRVYLLDRNLRPVPGGVPGELAIGGAGLARGYLGRSDATAERFLPDPFAGEPGERLYRTGDLARLRPDSNLEFLGRADFQVKVRGFRIELGEVEAALAVQPGVRAVAVLARSVLEGEPRLVAYVAGSAAPAELRRAARERLPEAMVPSGWVLLDALPLTPNGKVDRRALARLGEPEWGVGEAAARAQQAPRMPPTPIGELLAGLWRDLLGVERVDLADDFFALGGHSLLAARLAARVREALGVELPLARLFETPTLAGLAATVEALLGSGLEAPPLAPRTAPATDFPLSYAQERLWFLEQLAPGLPTYDIAGALHLRGPLAPAALGRALGEVIRRHETLRTRFAADPDGPRQHVDLAGDGVAALPAIDLAALPAAARAAEAARLVRAAARRPFDLASGPLLRAALLRLADREHLLLAALHHIVADGWSLEILLRELAMLYEAFAVRRPSPLPGLPLQLGDFALWERGWLSGAVLAARLARGRARLAGAPLTLDLPTDRPRPPIQSFRGARLPLALPEDLATGLAALARREGATPFMGLLAAFQALLGRYTGREDLLVGSPAANRGRLETEGLIGCFVNTLVLRADLAADPGFAALLGRTRRATLAAYADQDLPFAALVLSLAPERDLSRPPVVQVVLALDTPPPPLAFPGLAVAPYPVDPGTAKFDLTLELAAGESGLAGWLEYATDLFDAATVERLASHFLILLAAALADPARRLSALPLMPEPERQQVLVDWNRTARDSMLDRPVHERVAERSRSAPAALAVRSGAAELSYGDLDAAAERLARRLAGLGVLPESRVGLLLPRSPELAVAALAVGKAGGAYLPIDPGHPPERWAVLLADAGARVVVTTAALARRAPPGSSRARHRDPRRRRRRGRRGGRRGGAPRRYDGPRRPRLCHLYLGVDRPAERGPRLPRRARQSRRLAPRRLRGHRGRPRDPDRRGGVRRLGVGALALPRGRGQPPPARRGDPDLAGAAA